MPTAWETFPVEFKGGLVSNLSPLQQGINKVGSATVLQNYEPTKDGGYRKILGYVPFSTTAVAGVDELLCTKIVNSGEVITARSTGTATRYFVGSGTTWTTLATAANLGNKVHHDEYTFDGTHKVVFVDGVNYPAIYNDTTNVLSFLSAPTDVLGAKYVRIFKNHIFYANGSKLIYSAPFSETNFSGLDGAAIIDIGHTITGMIIFRDILFVFARNKIVQVTGSSYTDFAVSPVTQSIGCIDGDTIQEIGGDIMYLAPDGLRLLSATDRTDDFALEVASNPISKDTSTFIASTNNFCSLTIRSKAQYRIFAYSALDSSSSARGLLATKFSDQGSSDIQWGTLLGFKVSSCDSKYTESGEQIVFGNNDGYVYTMDFGSSFNGANINSIYESPYMPITDPQLRKTFYKLTLYVSPTGVFNLQCGIKYDFGRINGMDVIQPATFRIASTTGGIALWGTVRWNEFFYGGVIDKVYNHNLIGSGKTFSIRFDDNSTNPSHTLDAAIFEYLTLDRQ